jgi:hypothetical protein
MRGIIAAVVLLLAVQAASAAPPMARYAWLEGAPVRNLQQALAPPPGYNRVSAPAGSFAAWLRSLPLKAEGAPILLFDGRVRADQAGAAAIVDIDIGTRDLQQCADAVIRLRAEYLYVAGKAPAFNFTSGDRDGFGGWVEGKTAKVAGNRVTWMNGPRRDANHASLRQWLDVVFTYAGSLSLQRELQPVAGVTAVQPGDVLIQGGSPGHAIIVLDVARDAANQPAVLLAQSFMPAQSIHVLRNPQGGVWFLLKQDQPIVTPDWRFTPGDLRRFAE